MTPEQEEALGRLMAQDAVREGQSPAGKRVTHNRVSVSSTQRDLLRAHLLNHRGQQFTIKDMANFAGVSVDTARRFAWEFVGQGWCDFQRTKHGFVFRPQLEL